MHLGLMNGDTSTENTGGASADHKGSTENIGSITDNIGGSTEDTGNASTDNKGVSTEKKKRNNLVYSYNAETDTDLRLQKKAFMRHVQVFEGLSEIEAEASWQCSPKELHPLNAGAPDQRQVLHIRVSRDVQPQPAVDSAFDD